MMSCAFFLLSVLATVQFVIFENAGALREQIEAKGAGTLDSLSLIAMGNLGQGKRLCEKASQGSSLKLFCGEGQVIGDIQKVLYGEPDGTCSCPQRDSEDAVIFNAAEPPDLSQPTKCAVGEYTGITSILQERCCSKEVIPGSGAGDFSALAFKDKNLCESDQQIISNNDAAAKSLSLTSNTSALDLTCGGGDGGAAGTGSYAYNLVKQACDGKQKCKITVDDATQYDIQQGALTKCTENFVGDCPFALGSQSLETLANNRSTFSNCTSGMKKVLLL